nr:hypothetical protein [Tanacetum cinerariifolium]
QSLGFRVPLMGEEFKSFEPISTRTDSSDSSASSCSTTQLLTDHPLTHISPTPTYTRVSFHRKTARMATSSSSTPTLPGGRDIEEDKEDESSDDKGHGLGVYYHGLDDGSQGLEDEGLGLEEVEVVSEGQQQAVLVVETAASEPSGLGYGALRRRDLAVEDDHVPSTFEVSQSSRSVPNQHAT